MSEEITEQIPPEEMTDEEIQAEINAIDIIAKQNQFKYEKRQRGDFPDSKWSKFVTSQNEMFSRRDDLVAEQEARKEAAEAEQIEE